MKGKVLHVIPKIPAGNKFHAAYATVGLVSMSFHLFILHPNACAILRVAMRFGLDKLLYMEGTHRGQHFTETPA